MATLQYTCPMHPEIRSATPGKCPVCGMNLITEEKRNEETKHSHHHNPGTHNHSAQGQDLHSNQGSHIHGTHDKHAGHHTHDFLKRFWICAIITIPVLLLSPMIQHWLGFAISFVMDDYLLLALSTLVYIYGGMPFLKGMVHEIRGNAIGMMTLVAIAISVAYMYSVAVVLGLKGMDFFWELVTLIDIMLLGHWLEMRSQMAASKALQNLVALLPSTVHVEKNGQIVDIDLKELQKGDVCLVKPGEKIPADGTVTEGTSYINESMLTGESIPVNKEKGSKLIGGSINGEGVLKLKITATGGDSYLHKVIKLVSSAQASKSRTQTLADRVAKWLTILSITTGVVTFAFWFASQNDLAFALERMVTVMVTACPHALGVAIPLVVAISTSLSATNGLLIRNRPAFESSRNLRTIIFDKTGTLTLGSHEVQQIILLKDGLSQNEVLRFAASVQQNSEHHIAHSLIKKAREKNIALLPVEQFHYTPGVGVKGIVNGHTVISAGPNYFTTNNLPVPPVPSSVNQDVETINYLVVDNTPAAIFTMADAIRESSSGAIRQLEEMHIKSYLLTGDNENIAKQVSQELKMTGYFASVLPHEKQDRLKIFQANGEMVAMTGDGVNDAPALAQADVGIAVGSGTDVAAETADIILVNSDPQDIVNMIVFAKATYRKMIQNLVWAVGYNVIAIPLAAGVLYPGFVLGPAMGAILMSLSTVIVAINAQTLRPALKGTRRAEERISTPPPSYS